MFLGSGGRNQSNSQQLARIGEKKVFHELDVHHVYKVGIKRFWAQQAVMSLTRISSLESARRKFFMNSTYITSRKQESNVFWLRRAKCAHQAEMSIKAISSLESTRMNFSLTRRTSCLESRNQTFFGSGYRNEPNNHLLARISEKKIFHALDVHHVQDVGIKRFWAQDAEMSLTAISSLESAKRKFFMNSTYIMSRKQ